VIVPCPGLAQLFCLDCEDVDLAGVDLALLIELLALWDTAGAGGAGI
jgi:hypothetical protein